MHCRLYCFLCLLHGIHYLQRPISIQILFLNPYRSTNISTHFKFIALLLIPNKMILDRAKTLVNAEDSTIQLNLESLWQ